MAYDERTLEVFHELTDAGCDEYERLVEERSMHVIMEFFKSVVRKLLDFFRQI